MPPKTAPKEKVVKGNEAEEMVLQYLQATNRPYSSTDVSANLKNKVPKAAAQKILTTLAEKDLITMKTYGKQTIFVYKQSSLSVLSKDELSALSEEIKRTSSELDAKRKDLRSGQNDLAEQESQPKTKDISAEINAIQADNELSLNTLLPLRGEGDGPKVEPMSQEEIKKVDATFAKWRKEWVNRRKVYKDMLGMLQDGGMSQDKTEFEDEQGITLDDEDAIAVEQGEFCQTNLNRPIRAPSALAPKKPNTNGIKRSSTTPDPSQGKKKKVKKA